LSGKATVTSSSSSSSSSSSGSGVGLLCPFDAQAFLADLVPDASRKFLDIRSVAPAAALSGGRAGGLITADSPAASWVSLAESMVDSLPRYDPTGRLVTTFGARIIARGASQTDCDSVDPSLLDASSSAAAAAAAASSAGQGKGGARVGGVRTSPVGMRPLPPPWPGLPQTAEWDRVSMMLTRALTFPASAALNSCRTSLLSPLPAYPPGTLAGARSPVRTLTVASNSDAFAAPLVRTLTRAEELLAVGAYVHWYERYGVDGEQIVGAMHTLLDVVETYRPGGGTAPPPQQHGGGGRGGGGGGEALSPRSFAGENAGWASPLGAPLGEDEDGDGDGDGEWREGEEGEG
jgi:hypothetical protein